jgi:hypothetical protein
MKIQLGTVVRSYFTTISLKKLIDNNPTKNGVDPFSKVPNLFYPIDCEVGCELHIHKGLLAT